jgi:hypothetical protein
MEVDRDPTAVIGDGNTFIFVDDDIDPVTRTCQGFID